MRCRTTTRDGGPLDIPSVVTSALGFALTIWGLDGFARHEPAWTIAARVVVGLACATAFVRRQRVLRAADDRARPVPHPGLLDAPA